MQMASHIPERTHTRDLHASEDGTAPKTPHLRAFRTAKPAAQPGLGCKAASLNINIPAPLVLCAAPHKFPILLWHACHAHAPNPPAFTLPLGPIERNVKGVRLIGRGCTQWDRGVCRRNLAARLKEKEGGAAHLNLQVCCARRRQLRGEG
jgi:hypothetical protein